MANAIKKLKESLSTNVPVNIRIKKRGGVYPETNYTTKEPTGRNIYLYVFENEQGEELKHYANEKDEEILKLFAAGERLQVVLKDTITKDKKRITYLSFTPVDGSEARSASTPQLQSNTATTGSAKKLDLRMHEEKIKGIMIGLQGLCQSYISAGMKDDIEVLQKAVNMRRMIIEKAIEISND